MKTHKKGESDVSKTDGGDKAIVFNVFQCRFQRGHSDAVVKHSPPTYEVGGSIPGPYVGKLVVAY